MSMAAGSVTVNDDETYSGTGMALALYEALKTAHAPDLPDPNSGALPPPSFPMGTPDSVKQSATAATETANATTKASKLKARLTLLRRDAADATALAGGLVPYLQAHAEVSLASVVATVSTSASVGVLPTTLTAGTPIDPPGAAVDLPVTGPSGSATLGLM